MRLLILIIGITYPLATWSQTYTDSLLMLEKRVFKGKSESEQLAALIDKARFQKSNKKYKDAVATLNRKKSSQSPDSLKAAYYYELCLLHLINDNTLASNGVLYNLKQYETPERSTFLELLVLNDLHQWTDCRRLLLKHASASHLDTVTISKLPTGYKEKDEEKAERYSRIIPGLGQCYAGKPGRGITSFALNGSLLFLAGFNIYTGYYVTALNFGLLPWMKFYLGGIDYAEKLCIEYNAKQAENLCKQYRSAIFSLYK